VFLVAVDNVTSTQLHQIRHSLRGLAVILMGKNTLVRKAIREVLEEVPDMEMLLPNVRGNVGLVFTNGDLRKIRDIIVANKVSAPAKIGAVAQNDIIVPAGNTGIQPDKTSFFQALNIPTKVVKGAVEIMSDVTLIKTGQKVGPSEAELLGMLRITPFSYGLSVLQVFEEGSMYEPSILDVTDEVLIRNLATGIRNVTALSLQVGFPTAASVPHSFMNGLKKVLSIALSTEYSFPAADEVKKALENASTFVPAAASSAPAASVSKKAAQPVEEEKEESDGDM